MTSNARITRAPYISGDMRFDWPVQPMGARMADRVRQAVNGLAIFVAPGQYVVVRRYETRPLQRFQVWGAAGTYAQGVV
jgi:hypothetical protein